MNRSIPQNRTGISPKDTFAKYCEITTSFEKKRQVFSEKPYFIEKTVCFCKFLGGRFNSPKQQINSPKQQKILIKNDLLGMGYIRSIYPMTSTNTK
jgi:hypothetical protein